MRNSIVHKKKKIIKTENIKINKKETNNHKNNESKRIILNEKKDLINIPEQQLLTAKLSYFSGSFFDKLYKEALKIEHQKGYNSENLSFSPLNISSVIFKRRFTNDSIETPKMKVKITDKSKTPLTKNDTNKQKIIKKKIISDKQEIQNNQSINRNIYNIYSNQDTQINSSNGEKISKTEISNRSHLLENDHNNEMNNNFSNYIYSNSIYNRQNLYNSNNNIYYINSNNNSTNFNFNNNSCINTKNNIGLNFYLDPNELRITRIIFSIRCNTNYGENLGIIGSIPALGNWNSGKCLKLSWNDGNIWKGQINNNDYSIRDFEFKFIVLEKGSVKIWEPGYNNEFKFDKIKNKIRDRKDGRYEKYRYEYEKNTGILNLHFHWNK